MLVNENRNTEVKSLQIINCIFLTADLFHLNRINVKSM